MFVSHVGSLFEEAEGSIDIGMPEVPFTPEPQSGGHPLPHIPSFDDVGIPAGHAFPRLAYHALSKVLIAQTANIEAKTPIERLSMRHVSQERYSLVMPFDDNISISSFATADNEPLLFFITFTWNERGGNWDALYRFRLDSRTGEVVAKRGELLLPPPYHDAWPSQLLSATPDGSALFCTIGLQKGAQHGETVDYWLARVSIANKEVHPICHLKAVFL